MPAYNFNTELITNPTLDVNSVGWTGISGQWSMVTDVDIVHGGSGRSLKHTGVDTTLVTQVLTLTRAGKYTVSCWIKTVALAGAAGTGAYISATLYSDASYITVWTTTKIKGDNDWTHVTFTTDYVPNIDTLGRTINKLSIQLGCNGESTGDAYFDDVSVKLVDELHAPMQLVYPNSNLMLRDGNMIVGAEIWDNPGHLHADLTLESVVTCPDGTTLSDTLTPTTEELNTLSFDLLSKPVGVYSVVCNLYDSTVSATVPVKTDTFTFTKLANGATKPAVYPDRFNRLVYDNVPAFPIGAYCSYSTVADHDAQLTKMVELGMNVTLSYSVFGGKTFVKGDYYVAKCAELGIKCLLVLKDCYNDAAITSPLIDWTMPALSGGPAVINAIVNRYKDNDAVLGYYICDEAVSPSLVALIGNAYAQIKTLDPEHPCLAVEATSVNVYGFRYNRNEAVREFADIQGADSHPIKEGVAIKVVGPTVANMVSATQQSRVPWVVLELPITDHAVTDAELLCEAYQALCNGARGILYFNWNEYITYDADASQATTLMAHLIKLKSIAMGVDALYQATATAGIVLKTRMVNGKLWVLAVNPTAASIDATFTISNAYGITHAYEGIPGTASPTDITGTVGETTTTWIDTLEAGVTKCFKLDDSAIVASTSRPFGQLFGGL